MRFSLGWQRGYGNANPLRSTLPSLLFFSNVPVGIFREISSPIGISFGFSFRYITYGSDFITVRVHLRRFYRKGKERCCAYKCPNPLKIGYFPGVYVFSGRFRVPE